MIDPVPCQLTHMDQAIGTTQVDERTEVSQAGNSSFDNIAFLEFCQKPCLLLRTPFFLGFTLTEDQSPPVLIDFDHFDHQFRANQLIPGITAITGEVDRNKMRTGDKAF